LIETVQLLEELFLCFLLLRGRHLRVWQGCRAGVSQKCTLESFILPVMKQRKGNEDMYSSRDDDDESLFSRFTEKRVRRGSGTSQTVVVVTRGIPVLVH
jgi:hypothetical protein